ncbi:MAG: CYTH domain-containing protein [Firmicutes bacterium]|nr:CYTH domain-containing protein [Bacillota bacterium]
MEIEVKYAVPSPETVSEILADSFWDEYAKDEETETVPLRAIYYDTEDRSLSKLGITLRVRSEGSTAFCTAKWGGTVKGAVHAREEVNIPVPVEKASEVPDVSILSATPIASTLKEAAEKSPLVPLLEMKFDRSRRRLIYDRNVIELAVDRGEIITPYGTVPILELELEHYAGPDPLAVLELGEIVAEKYGLTLEPRSKYSRGLQLLKDSPETEGTALAADPEDEFEED